jgi:hypothetical protein
MILEPYPNKRVSLMEVHGILVKVWNSKLLENDEQDQSEEQIRRDG